jgi:hypothetical protein
MLCWRSNQPWPFTCSCWQIIAAMLLNICHTIRVNELGGQAKHTRQYRPRAAGPELLNITFDKITIEAQILCYRGGGCEYTHGLEVARHVHLPWRVGTSGIVCLGSS